MLLIPYKKFTIQSPLANNVLAKRLYENVENYAGFRWDNYSKSSKPFVGKVSGTTFHIRPVFKGRNSFVPVVHGAIVKSYPVSIIRLTVRLHSIVAIFLILLIVLMTFSIIKFHELLGIFFILFIYLMTIVFFNIEYSKTKKNLEKIFEVQVDREQPAKKV